MSNSTTRILRRPEVQALTGLPCSTIYEKMAKAEFPKPVKLGQRSVGWREADIEAWLASLKAA